MKRKIGVLHTSFVFVNVDPVIRDLVGEILPDVDVVDFVDSDVLAQVGRDGGVTPQTTDRMRHLALAAEAAGVDAIFSACSSLGPALDTVEPEVHVPVIRVDDAMARSAAANYERIGVLATVPTTLRPTSDLIRKHAGAMQRSIALEEHLCEGAFSKLMAGDREGHDAAVRAGAQALAASCDVIVLAQASMARLAPWLSEQTGLPVLSSPRMGVEDLARRLNETAPLSASS